MKFSDDGQSVTMGIAEYGELKGQIEQVSRLANERVKEAEALRSTAESLFAQTMNKEALVRQLDDTKNALNYREDAAAQVVRLAEHFMGEIYHIQGLVSRTNRTEIEQKMSELRKSGIQS